MDRAFWALVLCAVGCFDPAMKAAGGDASGDATAGSDGLHPGADGLISTGDAGPTTDGPPLADDCEAGTLCSVSATFAGPEPEWVEVVNGGCTITQTGGRLRITTTGDCVAGTRCEYRSPARPMGTGRVVTRTIEIDPASNGDLWFEVVDGAHDGLRLYFRPGIAESVIADGGGETAAGTVSRGDKATWGIRVDAGGSAHFERWDPAGGSWVELGSGDAPWTIAENVTLALGLTCRGVTSDPVIGVWGAVGGVP